MFLWDFRNKSIWVHRFLPTQTVMLWLHSNIPRTFFRSRLGSVWYLGRCSSGVPLRLDSKGRSCGRQSWFPLEVCSQAEEQSPHTIVAILIDIPRCVTSLRLEWGISVQVNPSICQMLRLCWSWKPPPYPSNFYRQCFTCGVQFAPCSHLDAARCSKALNNALQLCCCL